MLAFAPDPVSVDPEAEYPNLGLYSFARGAFEKPPIDGAKTSAKTLYRVRAGQFIYSRLFAFEGAYAVVPPQMDGYFVSNEYPTFDHDGDRVLPAYLRWLFSVPSVWRDVAVGSKGMGDRRQRVHPEQVLAFCAPLPLLDVQRRIVARLDRVAGLLEAARPLRARIAADAVQLTERLHFDLAEPEWRPLGDFIELWEDKVEIIMNEAYPQVGLRGFAGGMFFKEAVLGADTSYKTFNRLHADMLVVSQPKGWEGAVAVASEQHDGWFASPEYRTFWCNDKLLMPSYLRQFIETNWFQSELAKLTRGQGARRERLRPEMLLAMRVRMPKLSQQQTALMVHWRVQRLRALGEPFDADTGALIPATLHEIFRGEDKAA